MMDAVELLRTKGLKKTAQRVMFIDILQKHAIALTETEIKEDMGELYDRITFYRTVQILLDVDIIHRITVDNITVKYALNDLHMSKYTTNHAHFFCRNCHAITCLENMPLFHYQLPKGFTGDKCEILIKGLCDKCSLTTDSHKPVN